MFRSLSWLIGAYRATGNYEQSFLLAQKRFELALQTNNKVAISTSLYRIGQLYKLMEDYPNALLYYRRVFQMDDDETRRQRVATDNDLYFKIDFASIFSHLHQYDSAWYYYNSFKPGKDKVAQFRYYSVSTGECYFLQKDYVHALQNFEIGLTAHRKLNDRNGIMHTYLDMGKAYLALNNNAAALKYGREGLNMALQTKAKQFIRDGYQILSGVYTNLHHSDSAFFYYKAYISMKDIVAGDQLKGKFVAYNYEKQIELLNKEKQIEKTKFKTETFYKKILIVGILTLLLLSIVTFRNILLKRRNEAHRRELAENELQLQKLESEKKQEELQHKATELEMQALRAQMNPHFIFNCLSSINRFILKNESEAASDYLTKFSRLIRMVLTHSKQSFISLDDELEMLRLYLEMERLRFKYSFDYNINFKNEIEPENIFIPPLLLQPFAENAIWHGMMNKEGQGHLTISLSQQNNELSCLIEDNGVGRAKAAELKSKSAVKKKSLGLQITKERLALLNKDSNETTFLK
jgi:LytS/YehU family sensor histidine kinase